MLCVRDNYLIQRNSEKGKALIYSNHIMCGKGQICVKTQAADVHSSSFIAITKHLRYW